MDPPSTPPLIRRAKYCIETRFFQLRSVQEVAKELEISCEQLRERFRKIEDTSPEAYLRQCRVTYLRLYLSTTELSDQQVARRVGFESVRAANRAFNEATNHTMTQFRELFRQERDF